MKSKINLLCTVTATLIAMFATANGYAYETHTHAYISSKAFDRSIFGGSNATELNLRFGFDRLSDSRPFNSYWLLNGLGDVYLDNLPLPQGQAVPLQYLRLPNQFERDQIFILAEPTPEGLGLIPANTVATKNQPDKVLPLRNWLLRGTIREDDLVRSFYWSNYQFIDQPDADPHGTIARVFNHFYDPIHNAPLPDPGLPAQFGPVNPAMEWALGVQNALVNPPITDDQRRNHFTWVDARNNMWLALTGERGRDNGLPYMVNERAQDAEERMYRWATVFRSLGDVLHLVQDMAQPQHTRLDPHSPYDSAEQQAYEPYTNARVIGMAALERGAGRYIRGFFGENIVDAFPSIEIGNYPIVRFATPRQYFTTRTDAGGDPVAQRGGMADYSNRGFFTAGTLPPTSFNAPPQDLSNTQEYTPFSMTCRAPFLYGQHVTCTKYLRKVPDAINPGYSDKVPADYAAQGGKIPMVSEGLFHDAILGTLPYEHRILGLEEYRVHADLLLPRAIAYSAGLIDYFFRGQLEVSAPSDRVVGVLNQGATHSMNAAGYPCVGTSTADGCPIFGFEKIRVKVRNTTPTIVESGTNATIPQSSGGAGAKLVAVVRYHRNSCYKPDLSGERAQSYAPPPQLIITEPTCAAGQTVRTAYQEIAVSAPLTVTPGELDNLTDGVDRFFDFSSDAIPVNATDVFIQVVYRGALGQEPDGIALGTFDVREPTMAAFWNNTDQWWNGSSWFAYSPTYPTQSAKDFWVCSGGAPVKLVFQYTGATGTPALISPVSNQNTAGIVRLGFLFPPPDPGIPTQRKSIRGVSVNYTTPGYPQIPQRSTYTSGAFHQANKEQVAPATLAAPTLNCGSALPNAEDYWCSDPIQKRRNQLMGSPAQALYLEPVGGGTIPTDVDAVPLAAFAGLVPLASGTLRFNTDAMLASCPAQPAALLPSAEVDSRPLLELIEEARALGVSDEVQE